MTESVTPPDRPLVDPETGETPPLSPPRMRPDPLAWAYKLAMENDPEWQQIHAEASEGPARWWQPEEELVPSGKYVTVQWEPDDAA
jgi:hypothetical protein